MMLARLAGCDRTTAAQMLAAFEADVGRHAAERFIDHYDSIDDAAVDAAAAGCGWIRNIVQRERRWSAAMASAPIDLGPVTGRVDREGRLTAADPACCEAAGGSRLVARRAAGAAADRGGGPVGDEARRPAVALVIAASSDRDLDLWVRAEPDAEGVA